MYIRKNIKVKNILQNRKENKITKDDAIAFFSNVECNFNKIKSENLKQLFNYENVYNKNRDIELMLASSCDTNKIVYQAVKQILNNYEFNGSIIYSNEGLDKETIAQIVDKVIYILAQQLDEVEEITHENYSDYYKKWDRYTILKALVEAIVLSEIFYIKRPKYFNK